MAISLARFLALIFLPLLSLAHFLRSFCCCLSSFFCCLICCLVSVVVDVVPDVRVVAEGVLDETVTACATGAAANVSAARQGSNAIFRSFGMFGGS